MSLWFAYASHVITRVQPIILSVPIVPGLATVLSVPIVLSVPNVLVYQSLLDKCYNWMFLFPSSEWSSPYYRLVRILCSAHFIYFILIFFTFFFWTHLIMQTTQLLRPLSHIQLLFNTCVPTNTPKGIRVGDMVIPDLTPSN